MRENAICRYCVFKSRKTVYILDYTKNYHSLLQKEVCRNVQNYIWYSEVLFMEENGIVISIIGHFLMKGKYENEVFKVESWDFVDNIN